MAHGRNDAKKASVEHAPEFGNPLFFGSQSKRICSSDRAQAGRASRSNAELEERGAMQLIGSK